MALSNQTALDVWPTGDDANGGGFVAGASGVDRSNQAAAHCTLTTASVVHTTTTQINVDAGDYTVSADDVGNQAQLSIDGAALAPFQITAVDVGNNRWTVDRSAGTAGQTVAGKMGGALASPGYAAGIASLSIATNGIIVRIKSGTYTLTTTTPNVSGGPIQQVGKHCLFIGYETTRDDMGAKPVIDVGAVTGITVLVATSFVAIFINLKVDGQGNASIIGVNGKCYLCEMVDCNVGITGTVASTWSVRCKVTGSVTYGFESTTAWRCEATGCGVGFRNCSVIDCLVHDNTGDGIQGSPFSLLAAGNTCFNNGGDGIGAINSLAGIFDNIIDSNGGYGVEMQDANTFGLQINNAFRANTSGKYENTPRLILGEVVPTSDPFTNSATDDFSLNNTAGGGAELRGAGVPVHGQTDNRDIGAVQHADPAGGGGLLTHPGMSGGLRG